MYKVSLSTLYLAIFVCIIFSVTVSADIDTTGFAVPYTSYTFDFWGDPMPAPHAYLAEDIIELSRADINISRPQDIYVSNNNIIYIVDSDSSKIVSLNENWDVIGIIKEFKNDGQIDQLASPRGLFVDDEENIYVADTGNKRVVILNQKGELLDIIGYPEPEVEGVLPDNFDYKPIKVAVDRSNRLYVLSEDTYEGLLQFDRKGQFQGFIGAPRVQVNIIEAFWRERIVTEQQETRLSYVLPTEYSNIDIDERGFIYATVPAGDRVEREAVSKLNPSGEDVLRRNGFFYPIGDIYFPGIYDNASITGPSSFVDVAVQDYGIYSVLDRKRGRVFTYNKDGYLLYTFGFLVDKYGGLSNPVAIDTLYDRILVLDRRQNYINVFRPTEYAKSILAATEYHFKGEYDESAAMWEQVLKYNANYDLAYTGLGMAAMRLDNFEMAMNNFRLGNNREDYSEALAYYRKEVIGENFNMIVLIVVLLIIARFIYKKTKHLWAGKILRVYDDNSLKGKIKKVLQSLKYSLHLIFHPFDGFWDLKHEKRGNVTAAGIILLLVTLTYVFIRQYTGFVFNPNDLSELNLLLEMLSVLAPFMLWCMVNWSMTTLVEGKGTFRDIFITSSYALTPIVIINVPLTIISNFITAEEGAFYYFFFVLALGWAVFLLYFGMMVTHRFNGKKNFLTVAITIAGMVFVIFISVLFFNLAEQTYKFASEIYYEFIYRL